MEVNESDARTFARMIHMDVIPVGYIIIDDVELCSWHMDSLVG